MIRTPTASSIALASAGPTQKVATFCVGPAIANAIDDAVGVRLMEMPLNAEAVYRALRAKQGKPLEAE